MLACATGTIVAGSVTITLVALLAKNSSSTATACGFTSAMSAWRPRWSASRRSGMGVGGAVRIVPYSTSDGSPPGSPSTTP